MNTPTVLVVEDHADLRRAIAVMLRRERFNVVEAENGLEALSYLRAGDIPAAIVLDVVMPVMDGWEFLERFGANAEWKQIPVVIVTGVAVDPSRLAAFPDLPVLKKPVHFDEVVTTVRRAMIRPDS